MDPTTIFTSAKVAYDIAKGISALKSEVERNQAVSKVLEVLLAVQQDAFSMQKDHHALLTEKNNLEAQLLAYDIWEKEKNNYALREIIPGIFVYIYKNETNSPTPVHWICPNCYNNRKASIIQLASKVLSGNFYICPNCNFKFHTVSNVPPSTPPSSAAWT